ncbi:MAG: BglII/BstYI family type II restriction endonuclease [Clostridium sp.]|uniref:BglII/BstYI family type II restriction endonuclease n=1 Tax=Clostridium TaxID=1485 RepID=UPI0029019950|nr:BglII/BstYI family type II restriction endonuclease [Clostridium sp.]MDU1280008.1 BglII/BstYI family type II restriction endonuclease [Clostridium sp.]MDU7089073.1 BglII/BstYI family type II restriction endonuclease [Clostridium sp.]
MRYYEEYSHNFGRNMVDEKNLYEEIKKCIFVPDIGACKGITSNFKTAVEQNCTVYGWIINPTVSSGYSLTINAMKNKIGLTIQTGNIARAFYDLLKFQSMYSMDKIDGCVLVVPTAEAAKALGSNISNFNRVKNEMQLYKHTISLPCLIIAIDE